MISVLQQQVKAISMDIPYRHSEKIKLNQHPKDLTPAAVDALAAVILLVPDKPGKAVWERLPYADILKPRWQRQLRRDPDSDCLITDLPNRSGTRIFLQAIKPDGTAFSGLDRSRKLADALRELDPAVAGIQLAGFDPASGGRLLEQLAAALLTGACPMPSFKSKPKPAAALKQLDIHGLQETVDLAQVRAETVGNHLARWLSALPGNELTPGTYRAFVAQLARQEGWRLQFLDRKALARKKAGAFLAVCQGSPEPDAGIVHLQYRPQARGKKLALVGKGICFDTGGVNVKPAKYMNGMHEDMQGSAVALGTLLALSRLKTKHPVDCWLALAENHIGSRAYKPNDVVTACNGTTIEVKHTDAEGRMILADTLALASRTKPAVMIDYATLTGTCIHALSSRYSGVFSNRDALNAILIQAGRDSGERVWPFPLDEDFDETLKSDVADTLQCTLEGEADHILAARFLKRFVDDRIDWIHVDLAASNHKGGLAHVPTDTTGFGVRLTLNLLHQQAILDGTWN
ncbi:MAG: leucyl aminopeptidase family protein [Gammaproteobacteria bacterium]